MRQPCLDQVAGRVEEVIGIVSGQEADGREAESGGFLERRFICNRAGGIRWAILAIAATAEKRDSTHPFWTEVNQGSQDKLLVSAAESVVRRQGDRGFAAG